MTAEELLAAMVEPLPEDDGYCIIDPETRVITIPPEYQLLGVESDEKAERLYFKCPKIVGDDIDLSKLALRVNFRNAGQVVDQYLVDDVAVDGDNITFSWLLSRRVTQYEGDVNFIVCAVRVSGETITNEWNTTLATAQVLEGLEAEMVLPEEETDIVTQLLSLAETRLNDVKEATADANTAASNANQKAQEAENAAEDARAVTEQITKDSYLHTALQSFVDSVKATPTAYGNAIVKKIEGFIRQETTKGLNLMPLEITGKSFASVTVSNDGKDYRVMGENNTGGSGYVFFKIPLPLSELKGRKLYASNYSAETHGNGVNGLTIFEVHGTTVTTGVDLGANNFVTIPEQLREDTEYIAVLLYAKSYAPTTTNDGCTYKNLWLSLDEPLETWEPYTGGQPSPNPDYPMEVQGTGYRGFFDGRFEDGTYNSATGNPETGTNYIRCLNDIIYPLKSGDKIKFIYEKSVNIGICLFDKQGVLTYSSSDLSSEWEYTTTKDQEKFRFFILDKDGVNAETAKHLTITINGMYAICIRSHSPNLLDIRGKTGGASARASVSGETVQITTVEGSGNAPGVFFYLGPITKFLGKSIYIKADKMESTHSAEGKASCRMVIRSVKGGTNVQSYGIYQNTKAGTWMLSAEIPADLDLSTVTELCLQMYVGDGSTQVAVGETAIFENVMVCEEKTDEYHPYQSNVTYIPVDYPLFEGDKIVQRNGEYKLLRKMGFAVFDGDEDPVNPIYVDGVGFGCTMAQNVNIDESKKVYSNTFLQIEEWNNGSYGVSIIANLRNKQIVFTIPDEILGTSSSTGADEAKTKIKEFFKSNKTIVCYTLQTPTEEPLSPEAQKALHSIMATDEQTELTIVGVPADVGIQNQFLLPRNEDGALNTTAYCTSVKNKLTLDELLSQNLDARVNKLEIDNATLAEQTIMVE